MELENLNQPLTSPSLQLNIGSENIPPADHQLALPSSSSTFSLSSSTSSTHTDQSDYQLVSSRERPSTSRQATEGVGGDDGARPSSSNSSLKQPPPFDDSAKNIDTSNFLNLSPDQRQSVLAMRRDEMFRVAREKFTEKHRD